MQQIPFRYMVPTRYEFFKDGLPLSSNELNRRELKKVLDERLSSKPVVVATSQLPKMQQNATTRDKFDESISLSGKGFFNLEADQSLQYRKKEST